MLQCYSLNLSSLSFPHCVHKSVFYVCVSILSKWLSHSQKNLGASFAIGGPLAALFSHRMENPLENGWCGWLGRDAGFQSQCLGPVKSLLWTFWLTVADRACVFPLFITEMWRKKPPLYRPCEINWSLVFAKILQLISMLPQPYGSSAPVDSTYFFLMAQKKPLFFFYL